MTQPKTILLVSANRHKEPYPVYPLGVSYLATAIRSSLPDFRVEVFDCNLSPIGELAAKVAAEKYAYVGMSIRNADGANSLDNTDFMEQYREIARAIRENSTSPLILGGAGFSLFPGVFMRELQADYGIVGEGELSLPELISTLESGQSPVEIEGLVIGDGEQYKVNCRNNYLNKLNVEFEESLISYYWKHSGMLNIQTKRGCPYKCIYCSYPVIEGRQVRTLAIDEIIENILRLKREQGINYLFFTDSVFNIHNDYNREFAEKLIQSGADISWGAYFTPRDLDNELMGLLKRSGLTHVEFGSESFSDECLERYGKSFGVSDIMRTSQLCLDHNIYYAHFLIMGGYGETERTVKETIENSKRLEHTAFFPFIGMRIYPYTKLMDIAIAEGRIAPDSNLMEPCYYIADGFDLERTRRAALETGKAWIFPDDPRNQLMDEFRIKRNKKGPIWEYLRKP